MHDRMINETVAFLLARSTPEYDKINKFRMTKCESLSYTVIDFNEPIEASRLKCDRMVEYNLGSASRMVRVALEPDASDYTE